MNLFAKSDEMKRLAVFVSGSGTNMERIATFFTEKKSAEIALVLCNNPQAGAIQRANRLGIPIVMVDKTTMYHTDEVVKLLLSLNIDLIVLAGFLWLVPQNLLRAFPRKIVNIHPALLPAYGGKGMYGQKVHEAVIAANEAYSGISIHYVNEKYDEGAIIFQKKFALNPDETPASLAQRIHQLEYAHFPEVIESLLQK